MTDLEIVTALAKDVARQNGRVLIVGGYARDSVLRSMGKNIVSKDIDLEVYGLTASALQAILTGYGDINLVGASFGVLKLGQNIDISLPRKDSKVSSGHTGFLVDTDPFMSVFDAAKRRDFTINSLAIDPLNDEVIDSHNGVADLKSGILCATDPSLFVDDSLRVLRAMQLAARYNLTLSNHTVELCKSITLHDLAAERVGEEWKKLLLKAEKPSIGLEVARQIGVLDQLHPALAVLDQVLQDQKWHAEGSVWEHTKLAVDQAAQIIRREHLNEIQALTVMLGTLCHDIGKVNTTVVQDNGTITSYGRDQAGREATTAFIKQLALPGHYLQTVPKLVAEHMFPNLNHTPSDTAIRRLSQRVYPATIQQLLWVSEADQLGRISSNKDISHLEQIAAQAAVLQVSSNRPQPIVLGRDLIELGLQPGANMGDILRKLFDEQLDGHITDHASGIHRARELLKIPSSTD